MITVRGAARLLTCGAVALGCQTASVDGKVERHTQIAVPLPGGTATCWDVGAVSACYESDAQPRFVARTTPAFASRSKLGWRCVQGPDGRSCRDRADDATEFQCTGDTCVQRHARVPDAHEWTCSDAGGASLCLSKSFASGVLSTPVEAGFSCGKRRNTGTAKHERVCIDLSPDFPDGDPRGWNCHFEHQRGVTRICRRQPRPALGDPCEAKRSACPPGASCVEGHCLPPAPSPSCWLDDDCDSKKCRFGACVAG